MASSTSLFHHQVSRRHRWGFVVPHTSSVVFSNPVLSFAQISSVVVAASVSTAGTCALKTYSHFFLSLAQVKELLRTQLHNFSIYFINVWSFCCCICYLVFHMIFPSISMAVIDSTCIISVSEYSKSIRLPFKWI